MNPINDNPAGQGGAGEATYLETRETANADATPAIKAAQRLNSKSKRAAVLRCFLERGSAGLNCFEAVRLAHDYVLRTTVSECKRYHGIDFQKRYEQVPGHGGGLIECVRYVLTPDGAAKVRELLSPTDGLPERERRLEMTKDRWDKAVRAAEQEWRYRARRAA